MSRKVRLLSAISVVALLLASCGGGDSSGRTKNSALCYATQEEKDAAVKTAQDAFDAAMGEVLRVIHFQTPRFLQQRILL